MKVINFIKKILHSPLKLNELEWLKTNKPIIDEVIRLIDPKINTDIKTKSFYLEPNGGFYRKALNQQSRMTLNKIGIPNADFKIKYGLIHTGGEFKRMPGVVFDLNTKKIEWTMDNPTLTINISEKFSKNRRITSAVLVHEITHFYLWFHRLIKIFNMDGKTITVDEEPMCEITTFLLGLGKIYLNGVFQIIKNQKLGFGYEETETISLRPYFPWYVLLYTYERINFTKGIPKKISRKNLSYLVKKSLLRMSNHQDLIES